MSLPHHDRRPRRWPYLGLLVVLVAVAATVAVGENGAGGSVGSRVASDDGTPLVTVSTGFDDCGSGWSAPHGGPTTFSVANSTNGSEDVYLTDAGSGAVYGEVEALAIDATRLLPVVLGDGTYRFVCIPAENDPVQGPDVTIAGFGTPADATPAIQLVTRADLLPAAKQYAAWISSRLPVLATDARALDTAVASGDLAAARSAWLTAHLEYESLGAAYGAFGDADGAINGTPVPGTSALDDSSLTGFHKVEALLWSGAPATSVAPVTAQLVRDVDALGAAFADSRVNAVDVGLRAHEILENAIQFELTGSTDAGSQTNLATIGANIAGTIQALAPLEGVLASRYPALADTKAALDSAAAQVASYQHPDGSWTPLASLDRPARAALDASLDRTVELLAPIAAICDPRASAR
ncbi:imelysin family protein [Herbiconiux sp. UC225_62]|uniref:imelysin family protein n=1 Tax=Herbiconiux sp. UC225_62 TaxID=3350168 RepID=UPI0036D3C19C